MKAMTQKNSDAARVRGSAAVIGVGTGGGQITTHVQKWETKLGIPPLAFLPKAAITTEDSFRSYAAPLGPGLPPVSLPEESVLILHERWTSELGAMAQRNPRTRRIAKKLGMLPRVSTKEGAGGHKVLALTAALADLPVIDQRIVKLLADERDRCRFNARCDEGNAMSGADILDVYIVGAGFGSTCSGTVLLIASRVRHHAKLLGLEVRIHVILTTPSVARTHDPVSAWANFGSTCKEILLSMDDASRIVFHTFSDSTITHEAHSKLVDTFTLWGCSTGNLVAADRDEVASSIGLLLFYFVHSPLGGLSEAAFCDPAKTVLDRSFGYRGIRRMGLARFGIGSFNRKLAFNAATLAISKRLNSSKN